MKQLDLNNIDPTLVREIEEQEMRVQEEKLRSKYEKRFAGEDMPFVVRHKDTAKMSKIASYAFQVLSIAGLWYAVKVVLEFIPIPYLNYVLATASLIGFEIVKRKYSDKFWDYWFAQKRIHFLNGAINFLLLLSISMAGTLYGLYYAAKDGSPEAKYLGLNNDPDAVVLQEELRQAKAELVAFNSDPANFVKGQIGGQIYYKLLDDRSRLSDRVDRITQRLEAEHGVILLENEDIRADWKARTQSRIYGIMGLALIAEILFELCMRFNSKYDYMLWRTVVGRRRSGPTPPSNPDPGISRRGAARGHEDEEDEPLPSRGSDDDTPVIDLYDRSAHSSYPQRKVATGENIQIEVDIWKAAARRLKADQDAWRSKLQNPGSAENAQRHIDELEVQLEYIRSRMAAASA